MSESFLLKVTDRFSFDQGIRVTPDARRGLLAEDDVQRVAAGLEVIAGNHGGRRADQREQAAAVFADHADFIGHPDARLVEHPPSRQRADAAEIDQCGEPFRADFAEPGGGDLFGGGGGTLPRFDGRWKVDHGDAAFPDGGVDPLLAEPGQVAFGFVADVADPGVPGPVQRLDAEPSRLFGVGAQRGHIRSGGFVDVAAVEQHDRERERIQEFDHLVGFGLRPGFHHDAAQGVEVHHITDDRDHVGALVHPVVDDRKFELPGVAEQSVLHVPQRFREVVDPQEKHGVAGAELAVRVVFLHLGGGAAADHPRTTAATHHTLFFEIPDRPAHRRLRSAELAHQLLNGRHLEPGFRLQGLLHQEGFDLVVFVFHRDESNLNQSNILI